MATLIIIMSISRDSRKTIAKIHVHKKKIEYTVKTCYLEYTANPA